jgi:hypothetical protein
VHDKMRSLGMTPVPLTAALSRIFRDAGVARMEPRKTPRASFRRFVYPAPNACWQLDGTEYVLTGGRKCVIFQLIDDHSRLAVATHVTWGETSEGAIAVVKAMPLGKYYRSSGVVLGKLDPVMELYEVAVVGRDIRLGYRHQAMH